MRRLHFLAAILMAAMSMQAQREKPIPVGTAELQTSADTDGQQYYLYCKAGAFFYTSGNNWGTQATQGARGSQIYFRPFTDKDETEWDGNRFTIRNHISDTKGWNDVFITDNYLVNDCSGRGNNVWAAEKNGDEYQFYAAKFSASAFDEETYGQRVYIGYVPNDGTTTLQPTGIISEAVPVDWTLVKSADYEAWVVEAELYQLAEELKADIDETKEAYPDSTSASWRPSTTTQAAPRSLS